MLKLAKPSMQLKRECGFFSVAASAGTVCIISPYQILFLAGCSSLVAYHIARLQAFRLKFSMLRFSHDLCLETENSENCSGYLK